VVTITYQGDPRGLLYQRYVDWIIGSDYFATVGKDYGVGNGSSTNVVLGGDAPVAIQDSEIQALIYDLIVDGGLPAPLIPDGGKLPQQLYAIFYPYGTIISAQSGVSCQNFGGYHDESTDGPNRFAYAVIPNCDPTDPFMTEIAASHELIEASTNPLPGSSPAYTNYSYNNGWQGEVGDLCTPYKTYYEIDGGTLVAAQRIWSNSAANAGVQPCIPAPNEPYANISPDAGPSVPIQCQDPQSANCTSIYVVHPGETFTLTLTGWTSEPSVPFGIVPTSIAGLAKSVRGLPPLFSPSVSQNTYHLNNGAQAQMTITIPTTAASQSLGGFLILSGFNNDDYAYWPIVLVVL
jgi:hypothetical protein